MKMNKKQLKREKKNLRRLNEMKRIKKSIENSENRIAKSEIASTSYQVDAFGNFTRYVNLKGETVFDDTTETKLFGCEVVNDVPEYVRRFSDKMGLGECIRVPIRTKGLTGSGISFSCHDNSILLAMRFGGHRLTGYSLMLDDDSNYQFIHHSVWLNPEGNASCVSNNYDDGNTGWDDPDHILFIPVFLGHCENVGVSFHTAIVGKNWEEIDKIDLLCEGDGNKWIRVQSVEKMMMWGLNKEDFSLFTIKGLFHEIPQLRVLKKCGMTQSDWTNHNRKNIFSRGGFTQKSLATGKSWSEFKSELLAVA